MGLGSKRQLSLPQTEQEGAGDLAEVVPDTKVSTCGHMCGHTSCSTASTPLVTHTSSFCCVPPILPAGCAPCCHHLACDRRSQLCDLHWQDMTWGDREKVLRMLFASLQRQRQEPVQAPAQKVSYESDDDEVDNAGPLRGIMNLAGPAQLA